MQVNASQKHRQPSATTSASKSTNNRAKRKSRWKLKFHHQALPAEYLDHYEATLQNDAKQKIPTPTPPAATHTSTTSPSPLLPTCTATRSATTTKCRKVSTAPAAMSVPQLTSSTLSPSLQSTVRYKDLPYMGEMTLDNARPRRGRKPKKADICHLIYKNYGTTVVDEPLNLCLRDLQLGNAAVESTACGSNANDISVHKFKFVGGATPSLQEKRSATLDSSTNGAFRMSEKKSRSRNHDLKRKSRKSLAREKLEKTFEERGFLIQTQQLESAQGATYCKFRQLRKFTRYLFRSWKHHLPGDVVNTNEA